MSSLGNKEIMAQNIRRYMAKRGLDRKEFCKRLGFAYSTVTDWLNAEKYPRIDKIETMANFFGVSKAALVEPPSTPDDPPAASNIYPIQTKKVPLLGTIAAGVPIYADENFDGYRECTEDVDADFCLKIQGDSMIGARINDGDIVFIKKQPDVDNGEIAAVLIEDEATLKRVYKEKDSLILQAENPKYAPIVYTAESYVECRIMGKAVAFQSDIV